MEKNLILETRDLEKHFGGIIAVDKVNFNLYENEIVAIVGDNGAGKSTFIKIISGVLSKDSGKILIFNKEVEINNTIDAKKNGIETVYQDKGLVDVLNAQENLFLGREKKQSNLLGKLLGFLDEKYMRKETEKLLKIFGIDIKDFNSKSNLLSGGQQQSISVGRAIYWCGKIIIFDEPTNNLGVKEQRMVIDLIKKIRDEYKVSIIVVSHNLEHVFELSDRIVIFRNGKIIGNVLKKEINKNELVAMITGV
jgi:ABC-type sugar transport system ATPase subunit